MVVAVAGLIAFVNRPDTAEDASLRVGYRWRQPHDRGRIDWYRRLYVSN